MSFRPYESYQQSGAAWIGEVPAHWRRTALKHMADFQNGYPFKPEDRGDEGLPIIRIAQLAGTEEPAHYPGELPARVTIDQGDLLFSWSATIDAFIWKAGRAYLNQHIFKVTPADAVDRKYLYYVIKHVAPKLSEFDAHGSTMRHIKKESLATPFYAPPLNEQQAIAAFLDKEVAKIDVLLEEQRRLIDLLKEKSQAVTSHAVAKGLDPSAPMKDSGVEWLGEVPAHWEMKRARHIFRKSELPPPAGAEVVTCFRDGQVTLRRNRREDGFTFAVLEVGYQGVRPGHLVLHSMDAFAGAIGVCDSEGKCSPEYLVCDAQDPGTVSEYYGKLLRLMAQRGFILAACPSVRERAPRIRFPDFAELLLPQPPPDEQAAIAEHIAEENSRLTALQTTVGSASELLQERRAALIAAAVTGKIDVRDAAPKVAAA